MLQISNGGVHLASDARDGPGSMKRATRVGKGNRPVWEEEFVFPAALRQAAEVQGFADGNEDREISLHVKHLAWGKKWTGNNEGEWLGKATLRLSDIVACGTAGLTTALPIFRKDVRVGSSVLHIFAAASVVTTQIFARDVISFSASGAPSFSPPDVARDIHTWPFWRCMASHRLGDKTDVDAHAAFAHVHVGPDSVFIQVCIRWKNV